MAEGKDTLNWSDFPDQLPPKSKTSGWVVPRVRRRWHWGYTIAVIFGIGAAWVGALLLSWSKDLPSIERVYNIKPNLVTRLYDRHGEPFYEFYSERRVLTPIENIPKHMIQALLASEDRSFYDHWGVRWTAVVRGVIIRPLRGQRAQGGSTITQQLSRLLFLTQERTISRKIKEWMTAVRLERRYAKDEIIEMYLNQNYYGAGAYGVQAAAQTYFGKNAENLDTLEAATLVGLLPAPSRYSPLRNPDLATQRRNTVLRAMADVGYLDDATADSLIVLPITLHNAKTVRKVGDYFAEDVRRLLGQRYGEDTLYTEGLSIYTTIDTALQRAAEQIVVNHLDSLRNAAEKRHRKDDPVFTELVYDSATGQHVRRHKKLQAALVAIDNATGGVLAMVGGFDFGESEFNRATQALRQPGSAFKPFVLTAAVEAGYTPRDTIYDTPIVLQIPGSGEWRPNNFDGEFKGPVTIRQGYMESRNLVSIKLLLKLDPQRAVFYATRMGITTPLSPVPSLAIGSSEVYPIDMAAAYSTFANGGIKTDPVLIEKITDRFGGVMMENPAPRREEVLSAKTAYVVLHVLKSVIDRGTGAAARRNGFTRPAAGKTGTTNEYMDNWFVGFTPQITCAVWVGYDVKTPIGGYQTGTGAATSLPIWTEFMKVACEDLPPLDFPVPDGVFLRNVCDESNMPSVEGCPRTHEEVFTSGDDTLQTCPIHGDDNGRRKRRIRL